MNNKRTIRWLIPFPIRSSGGHGTIYTHMERLVKGGFECIACVDMRDILPPFYPRKRRIKELEAQLSEKGIQLELGHAAAYAPADIVVATSWRTAFDVAMCATERKVYFIQDYEPWFFPRGDQFLKAEWSYDLGLRPLVLGNWLAKKIYRSSGFAPTVMPFTVDFSIYQQFSLSEVPRAAAICYLHQPEKPRRCTDIAQLSLAIVQEKRPDIEIWSYGSSRAPDIKTKHYGLISRKGCAELYNRASVGLCLSASNPSRIPFEMAACGLPVVDIDSENTRSDAIDDVFLLSSPEPRAIADALINAIDTKIYESISPNRIDIDSVEREDELTISYNFFNSLYHSEVMNKNKFEGIGFIPNASTDTGWLKSLRRRAARAYIAYKYG